MSIRRLDTLRARLVVGSAMLVIAATSCAPPDPAEHPVHDRSGRPRELAEVYRRLMAEGDEVDMAALRLLDAGSPSLAIDALGRVGCLVDEASGDCLVIEAASRPTLTSPTADLDLLAAMRNALPATFTRSFRVNDPADGSALRFRGVHVVSESPTHTSFVLQPRASGAAWFRWEKWYADGERAGSSLHGVDDDELARWCQEPGWPAGW